MCGGGARAGGLPEQAGGGLDRSPRAAEGRLNRIKRRGCRCRKHIVHSLRSCSFPVTEASWRGGSEGKLDFLPVKLVSRGGVAASGTRGNLTGSWGRGVEKGRQGEHQTKESCQSPRAETFPSLV